MPDWIADFLVSFIFMATPGYILLQVVLPLVFAGRWRRRALLPLLVMGPILVFSLFGLMLGANLWPLWFIFASPFAFGYLVVLLFVRALAYWRGTDAGPVA